MRRLSALLAQRGGAEVQIIVTDDGTFGSGTLGGVVVLEGQVPESAVEFG